MNFLILSNGAPGYHRFFNALAEKMQEENHQVMFAVDCKASFDENKIDEMGVSSWVFSEYFAQHTINYEVLDKYRDYNLNSALLSDYERAVIYKIWGQRDNMFYERLKSALLSFFEEIVKKHNVDAVVYENVSNSFAHFCWFVCQKNKVKYLGLTASRLPGRFWITNDPNSEHRRVDATFDDIMMGQIEPPREVLEWCKEYLGKIEEVTPDYMKFNGLDNTSILGKYLKVEKIKKVLMGAHHLLDDHYHSYQRGNPLRLSFQFFLRSLKRKLRVKRIYNNYSNPVEGDKYLLYPLHFHPESSTSILSGTYLNEFEVIRNIAFNLPQGMKLYVKDHISAYGYSPNSFYKKIISLPNVRLLPPEAPTKKLIRNSEAVITLTSTVGYEALLLEKQVFLYGTVFYQGHKNVTKIEDPARLFEMLTEKLNAYNDNDDLYNYNVNYIAAYYMNTLPGKLNFMLGGDEAKDLASELYPGILKYLNKTDNEYSIT